MQDSPHKHVRAIVLRTSNFSEADRYCTLLSPELGLIEVRAKGARRNRSKLLLATEFLAMCDFELFYYKGRYSMNSADLVYTFPKIREDVERLTCASHLSDLLRDLLIPEEASPVLYELIARALAALEANEPHLLSLVHACELRLMRLGGYGLDLSTCASCHKALEKDTGAHFSFELMGLVCNDHRLNPVHQDKDKPLSSIYLSSGSLAALDWFSHGDLARLFSFKTTKGIEEELDVFMKHYLAWNLDKHYTKLDMLRLF